MTRSLEQALRELVEQRDFLLANTWVNRTPHNSDEGCLVARGSAIDGYQAVWVSKEAASLVAAAIPTFSKAWMWNDTRCAGPGEAIDVLDRAIALGKQRLAVDD